MADPSPQSATPTPALQSPTSEPPPPPPPCSVFPFPKGLNRPKLRVTSEFDSDTLLFFNKVSCKIFDNLAKLKLSFQNNTQREVSQPQVSFTSKYVSVLYDVEEKNAFVKSTVDVSPRLQLRALHNVKVLTLVSFPIVHLAQQGEVAMEANLAEPGYSLELSSPVPIGYASTISSPRATLKFPLGEVSVQEKEVEEEEKSKRIVSVNGVLKRQAMNGVCSALYTDEELRLRYAYKDEALSFIPTISLPSNAASFAFKRRFSPSDKLSYWYNFDSNMWSAVYKRTYGKDYKFKAGYDSDVRLGWASLWCFPKGHDNPDIWRNEDDHATCGLESDEDSGLRIPTQAQAIVEGSGSVAVSELKPAADVDYIQELLAIQQQGPRSIGFFGTRNMGFMHQELIEILSYAMVITKNHIYTSGASGTNAAVIRGALRAEMPELLTVILPQSLKKQPPESQELLSKVQNVVEKPHNDHLPLLEASRLCNMDIISQVQQIICFAFHDIGLDISKTVVEQSSKMDERSGCAPYKVSVSEYENVLIPLGFEKISIADNELAVTTRKGLEKIGRWRKKKWRSLHLVICDDALLIIK
ncbi:hypothetical protein HID58_052401 [Brassica napus]|uniref:Uncharacterized protein n=1 Tax=Brassica napus TaxID=3708 RepID=A0ABQ8ACF8_BRANA|nr:hypothetical protein HID58_052401 [Brassica napus]